VQLASIISSKQTIFPWNALGSAAQIVPPQQSASLVHVPVPAPPANDAQILSPVGVTRQFWQPGGQTVEGEAQTSLQALLMQTPPASQLPHEARPHLSGSLSGPQLTAAHCGSQHAPS
jgi:hypothetical protein